MRVLITGVPGWLGDRFLEILVRGFNGKGAPYDWKIRCLVLPQIDLSSIKELSKEREIECVAGDVRQPESLGKAVQGVDIVFHLIGIIHPRRIAELYEVNAKGTENILQACEKNGVKRIVYISSNSVGGTNLHADIMMKETDSPRPYLNYGKSKFQAEALVKKYHMDGKVEGVTLRPCWYYGPNQPARQTTFFKMIKKGNPIIFGDGTNLRSLTYLDNLCQAMILAATNKRAGGQVYWIADERAYTMNEVYSTIAELLRVPNYKPRHVPSLTSEMCLFADRVLQALGGYVKELHVAGEMNKNIACSIDKAQKELGYEPQISLREGMKRSIEWCRTHGMDI